MSDNPARVFRIAAIGEACSWLGLLVGMFFKYVVVENEIGVKIGPIHGAMFVAYLVALVWGRRAERWSFLRFAVGAVARSRRSRPCCSSCGSSRRAPVMERA